MLNAAHRVSKLLICFRSSSINQKTDSSMLPVSPTASTKFPRGTSSRRTFHGGAVHERKTATLPNGQADITFSNQQGRLSFINKITSKFSRK